MLVLIALLIGLCRHLNLKTRQDFGYGLPWRRFLRVALLWGVIGMMSAAAGAVFLLATQLRVAGADFTPSASGVARIFLVGLGSGIAVALLEETVFRGAHAHRHRARIGPVDGGAADRAAVCRSAFLRQGAHRGRRRGLGQRLRPAATLVRALGPSRAGVRLFPVVAGGGIDPESDARAHRQYRRGDRPARRLGGGAAHAAAEYDAAAVRTAYSAWVGRFDGLLGYWMLPWGVAIAAALWLWRASWVAYASGLKKSSL